MSSTTAYAVAGVERARRMVEVTGAWIDGTWVDDTVLQQAGRSAEGGFGFRVRSASVAQALVDQGLAQRLDDGALIGTRAAVGCAAQAPVVSRPRSEQRPARGVSGFCASTHHLEPMPALVAGRRGRGVDDPLSEHVVLCGRCAHMLGEAGFFEAA